MRRFSGYVYEDRIRGGEILDFYDDDECKKRFRFEKHELKQIFRLFQDQLEEEGTPYRQSDILHFHQFLIALRYYSTGTTQITCGDLLKVSQPSVSKIVARISKIIASRTRDFVKFPSIDQQEEMKKKFYEFDSFPGVVGAIDCTHIPFLAKGEEERECFRNYVNKTKELCR